MCFGSGRIRTLVAMATYISHRLIMGKAEIDNLGWAALFYCGTTWAFHIIILLSHLGYLNCSFTEMFID